VLQPSRSFPGEFLTLTGNVVTVVGSEIHTKSGFAESRRVKILYTEEFTEPIHKTTFTATANATANTATTTKSSNTRSAALATANTATAHNQGSGTNPDAILLTERVFSIIHIGRPLIGGVNAPSSAGKKLSLSFQKKRFGMNTQTA
jgi:autotransporter adhesin